MPFVFVLLALAGFGSSVAVAGTAPIKLGVRSTSPGTITLEWDNYVPGAAYTPTMAVKRDGVVVVYAANPLPIPPEGNTVTLVDQPAGAHTYQVCDTATLGRPVLCSNTVTRTL